MILGLNLAGPFVRYARSSLLEVIRQDYLTTARAKGLWPVGWSSCATRCRMRLIPLITVIGIQIPALFAGAVVIEQIFSWPGMGQLALAAITQRDYPVLMGFTMVIAVLVLLSNLAADIAYAVVDPRIRLSVNVAVSAAGSSRVQPCPRRCRRQPARSPGQMALRRFLRHRLALLGLVILVGRSPRSRSWRH